ncbi:MAG: MCE family protein [Deltaproteobacteria bacterium]|nr:MCE family protein [Deltaproteobacteria bacterium]
MNRGITTNAKIGIFVAIVLTLLFWITFKISGGSIFGRVQGYTIRAVFDNVQGLNTKTGVFIAGIKIGYVDDIKLHDNRALVILRIMPGEEIGENAKAIIKTKGLLGEKYIDIVPGKEATAPIKPGGEILFTESPPDFEELMDKLDDITTDIKAVTQSLNEVFGGPRGVKTIKDLVGSLNRTIDHVDNLVTNTDANLNSTFDSVNAFAKALGEQGPGILTNLAEVSRELHTIIAANGKSIDKTISNISSASEELDRTLANLREISDNLKEGKGTIGKLLTDEKTEKEVSDAISGLSSMIGGTSRFRTIIDYRSEYQFTYKDVKSYLNLRLQPTWDKYYLLGIVDDPLGSSSTTTTNNALSQLKINAEIAKRISYFTFRGGIIESTGGIGIDVGTPDDHIKLSAELFNFNERPYPELKTMLSISIFRYFLISGGMTDIMNRDYRTWFFGVGLNFNDEDLKNVFGLAASAASANSK